MEITFSEKDLHSIADMVAARIKETFAIPAPTAPSEALLGVKGAADYLGASESFISRMAVGKKIPVVKVGSHNRFRRVDLDRWVTKNTVRTVI